MASGPCLRRCRVVRRYMPIRLQFYRLDVKSYPSMHVSMYFESFWEGNAVNTGVPCLKVPMHRKLRSVLVRTFSLCSGLPRSHCRSCVGLANVASCPWSRRPRGRHTASALIREGAQTEVAEPY